MVAAKDFGERCDEVKRSVRIRKCTHACTKASEATMQQAAPSEVGLHMYFVSVAVIGVALRI